MRLLSDLLSFIVGVILAAAIMTLGGVMAARYLAEKLTATPSRPTFSDELSKAKAVSASPTPKASPPPSPPVAASPTPQAPPVASPAVAAKPSPSPTPQASPKPSPSPEANPPGSYEARVSQPIGLVLRSGPSRDAGRIGGLDYNQPVVIIGESADGQWLRVKLVNSSQEGWIKSGNTSRVN